MSSIRWMTERDLASVLNIEQKSFEFPWTLKEFEKERKKRTTVALVSEYKANVSGYIMYDLEQDAMQILNMAVHPDFRLKGIGRSLLDNIKKKLSWKRRFYLEMYVRETNLDAQLFLRKCGFKAVHVARNWYDDIDESAYVMNFHLQEKSDVSVVS